MTVADVAINNCRPTGYDGVLSERGRAAPLPVQLRARHVRRRQHDPLPQTPPRPAEMHGPAAA